MNNEARDQAWEKYKAGRSLGQISVRATWDAAWDAALSSRPVTVSDEARREQIERVFAEHTESTFLPEHGWCSVTTDSEAMIDALLAQHVASQGKSL